MSTQGVLTVVVAIVPDRVDALTALLDALQAALDGTSTEPPLIDFSALETVHFARFAVLPANADGARDLVFSTAFDGPEERHLSELCARASAGLAVVFEHCVGFSPEAKATNAVFHRYFVQHRLRHGALHVGYVGRAIGDVADEERVRRFIEQKLDAVQGSAAIPKSRVAIRRKIIDWVKSDALRALLEPRDAPIGPTRVEGWERSAIGGIAIVACLLGGAIVAALLDGIAGVAIYVAALAVSAGVFLIVLRRLEETDPAKTDTDYASGQNHAEDEDFGIRNQLTHLVDVKPGLFRLVLLRAVLFAIELRARFQFYKGDLGGLETIHCAHWLILPGAKPRLLFISNYDGSFERYLGDFIEEAGKGMTAVWSNTVNFPRSRYLLLDGATNERVFKAWTRENQVRTQVWYAALPEISIRNVNDNSTLRDGLRGHMTEEGAEAWLRLL
jgi:hypothetical protein